jgi:chorismate lyase
LPSPYTTSAGSANRRQIRREPLWRPVDQFTSADLPADCRPWLTDDGSLTARLIGLNAGKFRVQRLFQGWGVPLPSEQRLLAVAPRELAMIREVVLSLGDNPVVFARSVFPLSSLEGKLGHLRRLQNRSLGAILFQHPSMQRSPFELSYIPGDSGYLPGEFHQSGSAWGRRSRFDISGKKLMVSEVFLESFTPWRATLPVHRSQRGRVNAAILSPTQ